MRSKFERDTIRQKAATARWRLEGAARMVDAWVADAEIRAVLKGHLLFADNVLEEVESKKAPRRGGQKRRGGATKKAKGGAT
jgi:hypothetical protein